MLAQCGQSVSVPGPGTGTTPHLDTVILPLGTHLGRFALGKNAEKKTKKCCLLPNWGDEKKKKNKPLFWKSIFSVST